MKNKYFIIVLLLMCQQAIGQQKDYNFINLDSKNGMSSNTVNAILKDKYGFMWFGTEDGLNRFDGINFTVYRHTESEPTSVGRGTVMALQEDKDGNLWVGTTVTLSLYNRNLNNFTNYDFSPYGWIRSLYAEQSGNIWVGTYTGLYYFNPKTKKILTFKANSTDKNKLNSDVILSIFEDHKSNIWVGTSIGLHLFNKEKKTFKRFLHNVTDKTSISDSIIRTITEDEKGNLWLGTDGGGLNVMDVKNGTFKYFKSIKSEETTLSSNKIYKIVFDKLGKLWVGTEDGLNIFDPKSNKTTRIKYSSSSKFSEIGSFIGHSVIEIYLDKYGIAWIGTLQSGVNKYDINLAFFNHEQFNPVDTHGLSAGSVTALAEHPSGDIYVGTDGGGLNIFNRKTGLLKQLSINGFRGKANTLERSGNSLWLGTYLHGLFQIDLTNNAVIRTIHFPKTKTDLSDIGINCIKTDSQGNIWIGSNGNGIYKIDQKTAKISHFSQLFPQKDDRNLAINGYINAIEEDKQGNLWFGANGSGLASFNPRRNELIIFNHGNSNLPLDRIMSICCDKVGRIWLGVFGGGLCLYEPNTKRFIQFGEKHLLANDMIYMILEDKSGKLWVSTNKGISVFDPNKKIFKNYTHHNGIQQSSFNIGAGLKTSTGEMYFGGLDGFNFFTPEYLNQNKKIPNLVITDLKIANKSINPSENSEITEPIYIAKKIELSYKQNFTLDFIALNYTSPKESQYSYMLEGLDKEWNKVGSATSVGYTNLDPGKYTFRLKANSEDGAWHTPEKTIEIIVNPPFWRTFYAYFFYFFIIVFTFWSLRRRGIQKLRNEFALEQERLQVKHLIEKERTEAERKMELEQLKIKFLTNLSHELKTPLTLVINPIESLLSQEKSNDKLNTLNLINRNARRLLNLVNQLLDFRKIEDNELKLNPTEDDLIAVGKEIFESFKYISERKKINLHFESSISEFYTVFDKEKVERILFNLLSNAIKFTNENGDVYFHIETEADNGIKLIIGDSGIGLPKDMLEKIFDRFYQINNHTNILNQGSGIGLSITQEFVKLHGGNIKVESEEGMGSVFTVYLPLITKQFNSNNTVVNVLSEPLEEVSTVTDMVVVEPTQIDKPVILIVDDSEDLRTYLKDNLKEKYKIIEAADGKQGWQKALTFHPKVIVSDVNMPNMDGIALTQKIKKDSRTKHIPVILLTVLSEEIDQLKGLQTGASDYLTKPFSFQLLNVRIENLLNLNSALKDTYSKQINLGTAEIEMETEDEKFLVKIIRHIEENISEADLSIEELSKEMNMSRGTLYSKILNLTGEKPVEFVRSIKLKKAAMLLEKSDMKISQIGYEVGFSNPNYFARAFRAKYNVSPSEYILLKKDLSKSILSE
ncbi:hybrid sensor histidine kinase/response regulator transcription factor [Arcicella rosea]|uniref:histidine kinase n=1 Tax=Arcicella rosea TaxID=502909 RepID=A0A841ERZ2_9BACT|nr:hybrid sensor histidine kinase/response regulator transcription factor [Arcicella rosea]MBB6003448.1 signal transduction histidine kinase/ligand-binding sensor domain-containing protein/DNA-binding response OmpR family regulator [Arcicella rosea]